MEDLYAVLGVEASAAPDEIRKAYRASIRHAHPDVRGGDEARAKAITAAYGILSDPQKRLDYDRTLRSEYPCPLCGASFGDLRARDLHRHSHVSRDETPSCDICARRPAARLVFKASAGFLFSHSVYGYAGDLCRVCAIGMHREFQARNITRGPWSIISVFAAMVHLVRNTTSLNSARLDPPTPADPAVDAVLRGRPVLARPAVLASLLIVALIVTSVTSDVWAPRSGPAAPASTDLPREMIPSAGWEVGGCADVVGVQVRPVPCSDPDADTAVIGLVGTADVCPIRTTWTAEVTPVEVACLVAR